MRTCHLCAIAVFVASVGCAGFDPGDQVLLNPNQSTPRASSDAVKPTPNEVVKDRSGKQAPQEIDDTPGEVVIDPPVKPVGGEELVEESSTIPESIKRPEPTIKKFDTRKEATAKGPERRVFGKLEITLPPEWRAIASDFGAEVTLAPMNESIGRAIDVYLEAVPVDSAEQAAYRAAFRSKFERSLDASQRVLDQGNAFIVQEEGRKIQQGYLLRFTTSGVVTVVVTTRDEHLSRDLAFAEELLETVTPVSIEAVHADAEEALGMRFDMPSGWLCDLSGGEILLRGSWRNGRAPTINLRWVNTTIDDEVGRAAYLRSAREEIIEAHGGLLEVSDLSERFFGPHFGAEIEAQSKNTERPSRTWMVAFCSKRILTLVLVGPDDATKQSARALIASLAKGAN